MHDTPRSYYYEWNFPVLMLQLVVKEKNDNMIVFQNLAMWNRVRELWIK